MKTIAIVAFSVSLALFGCGEEGGQGSSGGGGGAGGGESSTSLPVGGVQKLSDCLGSPLANTCFGNWVGTCFTAEGACTNEPLTATKNRWTWDNGLYLELEIVAMDEADPDKPVVVSSFKGYESDGTLCIDGKIEMKFLDETTIEFIVEDQTYTTVFFNEFSQNRVDLYCPGGDSFILEGSDADWARSCFFGPYAEPCGPL